MRYTFDREATSGQCVVMIDVAAVVATLGEDSVIDLSETAGRAKHGIPEDR